ncbi:MAG: DUF4349 domain-containing protein [Clostridia bacterium]|nr:DUF4349 domain-containing protein [Clostridia bacterium]
MKRRKILAILLASTMIMSLAACGSKKSDVSRTDAYVDEMYSEETSQNEVKGKVYFGRNAEVADSVVAENVLANEESSYENPSSEMNSTSSSVNVTSQKLIKRKNITVDTTDFDNVIKTICDIVKQNNGYVESSDLNGTGTNGSRRTAHYTFRVPVTDYDTCCEVIGQNCTISSMNESVDDVTSTYIDIESHLVALRAEYDTLIGLLEQAPDLDTIILLQNELTSVRYEIESYEGNLRYYDNQTSYSTISVCINEITIEEEVVEKPLDLTFKDKVDEAYANMKKNVKNDYENFVINTVEELPHVIARVLLWIIVIVAAIIIIKKARRKFKSSSDAKTKEVTKNEICSSKSDESKCDSRKPSDGENK